MNNKAGDGANSVSSEPWLSPSEALTRFVSSGTKESGQKHTVAPIRFGVRIGDIGLLIPARMPSELVDDTKIYPLPTTPLWFRGLINLRGNLVPVFDLKQLFRMDAHSKDKPKLLVLNSGEQAVGILVDGLPFTLNLTHRLDHVPPLPLILGKHTQTVYARNQEVWVELDIDGFFSALDS